MLVCCKKKPLKCVYRMGFKQNNIAFLSKNREYVFQSWRKPLNPDRLTTKTKFQNKRKMHNPCKFPSHLHSQSHMQCSALIIFKINFYLWLFFFSGTRSIHPQHTKLFSSAPQPSSSSMNIHFWLSKSLSSRTNPLLISY